MFSVVVNTGNPSVAAFKAYTTSNGWTCPAVADGNRLASAVGGGGGNYHAIIYPDKRYERVLSDVVSGLGLEKHQCGGSTTYSLVVNYGSGDGEYEKDATITITADAAPSGKEFDKWAGDVDYISNVNSSTTTLVMPAQDIRVTATYKDKEPIVKKDNYMVISSWELGVDDLGSSVSIDSSKKVDTILSVSLDLKKSDEASKKWAWAQVSGYADGKFDKVSSVELIYYADNPVNLVLDQDGLAEKGESYLYQLPAASRGKLVIHISDFKQPSWVKEADATPLDLSKVLSVSFSAVNEERITKLEIQGIYLEGFEENTPIINQGLNIKDVSISVSKLLANKLMLNNINKGVYQIAIFNASGQKVISKKRELSGACSIGFGGVELTSGVYIVRMSNTAMTYTFSSILK